jgi:hypothetical protein
VTTVEFVGHIDRLVDGAEESEAKAKDRHSRALMCVVNGLVGGARCEFEMAGLAASFAASLRDTVAKLKEWHAIGGAEEVGGGCLGASVARCADDAR